MTLPPDTTTSTMTGDRVAVVYPAPHGHESFVARDNSVAAFGRGAECPIRFGYAPTADTALPRLAGYLVVANHRVFVQSAAETGRAAIEIRAAGRPPMLLAAGEAFSPAAGQWRIVVHGDQQTWPLDVTTRAPTAASHVPVTDYPTQSFDLAMTVAQRRVLAEYLAPVLRGRVEPGTHREVADRLGMHQNSTREVIYSIWSRLFALGVPMPDVADKRVAVVEAMRLHGFLETPH